MLGKITRDGVGARLRVGVGIATHEPLLEWLADSGEAAVGGIGGTGASVGGGCD